MKNFKSGFLYLIIIIITQTSINAINNIKVDQFGYLPNSEKIAVISQSNVGRYSPDTFTPGTTYEVRKVSDNSTVFSGQISAWNGGILQDQSGDKVWQFNFSSVTAEGDYYIFDVTNNKKSYNFSIKKSVYKDALNAALKVFYYQRRSTDKPVKYAGADWSDGMAFMNAKQDSDCMLYGSSDISTKKDLRGGWFDAGDYNQYVTFTVSTITDLLLAYQNNPQIWGDKTNIPESGNGVPDILDEVKWELDWIIRMQNSDGSVLSVKGEPANEIGISSPPSSYTKEQRYGPATTAASYAAAAVFALASKIYDGANQKKYALYLMNAAISAYNWAVANPNVKFYNSGKLCAGENQPDSAGVIKLSIIASIYLFDITGNSKYKIVQDNNIDSWNWVSMFETEANDAWLDYMANPNATSSVVTKIKNKYISGVVNSSDYLASYSSNADGYRAYVGTQNYTWGSNKVKSAVANSIINVNKYNIGNDSAKCYNAALGYLNYMHGVNPNDLCYLTNMSQFGAGNCTSKIYHTWFEHGSKWDNNVPPGYMPGGPDKYYTLDGCCPSGCGSTENNKLCNNSIAFAIIGQPAQKSYANINDGWPVDSWQITEPGIYYQAAYVRLVSTFVFDKVNINFPTDVLEVPQNKFANDLKNIKTSLFPNPTSGNVKIMYNSSKRNYVKVFNEKGNQVNLQITKEPGSISIDFSNLTAGNYFVELIENNSSVFYKVIKM